jgi:DNA-binding MarR family transcriptional regulator
VVENRALRKIIDAIEAIQAHGPSMPLGVARTFLLVCMDEGKTVTEYQKMADVSQASMSRHLLDLGAFTRSKKPGMGLLKAEGDTKDLRVRRCSLTPKGHQLKKKIRSILED